MARTSLIVLWPFFWKHQAKSSLITGGRHCLLEIAHPKDKIHLECETCGLATSESSFLQKLQPEPDFMKNPELIVPIKQKDGHRGITGLRKVTRAPG
mmetsp:Transcript_17170/g.39777  ORF Transcript_17170/g.39777 Transcript_17170/m.39777 type:complete len:97 (-) Transcript_17170:158-448(-)